MLVICRQIFVEKWTVLTQKKYTKNKFYENCIAATWSSKIRIRKIMTNTNKKFIEF